MNLSVHVNDIANSRPKAMGIPPTRALEYVSRGAIEADLRGLLEIQGQAAVVGVQGMGGIGKTELCRMIAQEWQNSGRQVMWISAGNRTVMEVQHQMAQSLGIQLASADDLLLRANELRAWLQQRPHLLVLDDVRMQQATELEYCLPPCPPCALLVSSRLHELSALPPGCLRPLDVMSGRQSQALLRQVPGLAQALDREHLATVELCDLCGHHPLALDLASRYLHGHLFSDRPVADLVATLRKTRLALQLAPGPLGSLRANFELSYCQLSNTDQDRFRALAAFATTGFSTFAATAVWSATTEAAAVTMDGLLSKSLILPTRNPNRYRLHDLLHEYAQERLASGGAVRDIQLRHAKYLVSLFARHSTMNSSEPRWEEDNLRVVVDWAIAAGDGELVAQLATQSRTWLYNCFRNWSCWESWLTNALSLGVAGELRANVLKLIGEIQQILTRHALALASFGEALALYTGSGKKRDVACTLRAIGDVQQSMGDIEAASATYNDALALCRAVDDRLTEAFVLQAIGEISHLRSDHASALNYYDMALSLCREVNNTVGEAKLLTAIARVYRADEQLECSMEYHVRACRLFRSVGHGLDEARSLEAIGEVYVRLNQHESALASYGESLKALKLLGDRLREARVWKAIGDVQRMSHHVDAALESYVKALQVLECLGEKSHEMHLLTTIGDCHLSRGNFESAHDYFQLAFERCTELNVDATLTATLEAIECRIGHCARLSQPRRSNGIDWSIPSSPNSANDLS